MTYELTQEQEILRETVRDFAQSEIAPLAAKIDWEARVPKELMVKLPSLGLFGITVPSNLGGAGADFLSALIACEEISKASGSLGAQVSFHNAVVCEGLVASQNAKLRETLLRKLASGVLGTFDFSSISSLSKSKQIVCNIEGNELVVSGSADFVPSAADAEIFLICGLLREARSRVLFAFSKDEASSAFSVGESRKLMGMRALGAAEISFTKMKLPLESLVCEVSQTNSFLDHLLMRSRLAVASQALGIGQASLDSSLKYANERIQFNTKIGSFYAVQDMIASDSIELETARSLCYLTSSEILTSKSLLRDSAIAKVAASNAAVRAARHCVKVHGGYGFTRDYPAERYMRDARLIQIYTETNEELKSLIAKSLLGQI